MIGFLGNTRLSCDYAQVAVTRPAFKKQLPEEERTQFCTEPGFENASLLCPLHTKLGASIFSAISKLNGILIRRYGNRRYFLNGASRAERPDLGWPPAGTKTPLNMRGFNKDMDNNSRFRPQSNR